MDTCELCGREAAALGRWKRVVPDHSILMLCAGCGDDTRRNAADRGGDADYPRIVQLAHALAGEVWTDGPMTYWFRDPLTVKKQPEGIAMWVPRVQLPTPSRPSIDRRLPAVPKRRPKRAKKTRGK